MVGENGSHWAILEIAEQAAPGNTITLWPRIAAQLAKRSRKTVGSNLFRERFRLAVGLGLLLLLIGSLIFVPAVRAFTESIIQRLGIAFVDTEQFGPNTEVGKLEPTIIVPPPSLTLQEIHDRITFMLLTPTWLPEGLTHIYRSMHDMQSGQVVDIQYCRTQDLVIQNGCLVFQASHNAQTAPPLLAESKEQVIEVNGQPGIYVHGGWQDNGKGDPNTRLGNLLWDDQVDVAYLTWMQNGVTYLLEAHNLGLGLEDMQRIATSMTEK
jgi:hypothetical protein